MFIKLYSSVSSVGVRAFSGCSGFTGELTIPASVTTLRSNAFEDCTGLTAARFLGDAPQAGDSVFGERDDSFVVYRPAAASDWPAAGETWNGYRTAILEQ